MVHENSGRVNLIKPLFARILPLLEERLPARFRRRPARPHHVEIQLVFPWMPKR